MLGVAPTYTSEKGKRYGHAQTLCDFDAWDYYAPVMEERPLDEHIMALDGVVRPHMGYLHKLKRKFKVYVVLSVLEPIPRFEIGHHCLRLFTELEIPVVITIS